MLTIMYNVVCSLTFEVLPCQDLSSLNALESIVLQSGHAHLRALLIEFKEKRQGFIDYGMLLARLPLVVCGG